MLHRDSGHMAVRIDLYLSDRIRDLAYPDMQGEGPHHRHLTGRSSVRP